MSVYTFLVTFGIIGVLLGIVGILDKRYRVAGWLTITLSCLLIITSFILGAQEHSKQEDKVLYGCSCGGNYQYTQAVGHMYATRYLYVCDRCGEAIELVDKIK